MLLACAACGDNIELVTIDELAQARLDAECSRLERCGAFDDAAACTGYFRLRPTQDLVAAVHAAKVRFDPLAAERCLRDLASLSCDATQRNTRVLPTDCTYMLVGSVAADGLCYLDEECASRECDLPSCPRDSCCGGACHATRVAGAPGASCSDARDCAADTYCHADKTCHALEATGRPCFDDHECGFGLACINPGIDPGTCRALPLVGESCPYFRCAEVGAICSEQQMCVAAGPGSPCTSDAQCTPYDLCNTTTGRCEPVPTRGQACTTRCSGASWCDRSSGSGICAAPQPTLSPCMADDHCASQLCEEGPAFDFCVERPQCI